jgi:hypothetical protein
LNPLDFQKPKSLYINLFLEDTPGLLPLLAANFQ